MNPLVAVITPTKSRVKLLCEAMDSVRGQSFDAWEHLIVDDGSDDGTSQEVARRAVIDPRIRYIRRNGDKSGANVCRNIGVRESRADFTVFLDSDDLLRPQCLERRVEIMQRNSILDFTVFRAGVFLESVGDLTRLYHPLNPGDDLLRFLAHECVWEISGPIWRRSFLEEIGCFDETLLSMQDLEMHVRALSARPKYVCFAEVDHDVRWQRDATKTSVRHYEDPTYIEAAERVHIKLLDMVTTSGLLTWSRRRALLGLSFGAAASWVRSRRFGRAVRVWNTGCARQQAPLHLQIVGLLMLCAARLGERPDAFCWRLVNKWKGWSRFRQEPSLVQQANASSPKTSNGCAT
jgi:glycosyltransferase involved in cell wall biosynthesis